MSNTLAYENFRRSFSRVEAFFVEICNTTTSLRKEVVDMSRELALIQLVSMIDVYRSDIMNLLLRKNRKFLEESKEKMDHKIIVQFNNWDDLFSDIINIEVEKWTKVTYKDWIYSLRDKKVLEGLKINGKDVLNLEEIISTRNILVHNDGLVDKEYQRRSSDWLRCIGKDIPNIDEKRTIDNDYYENSAIIINMIISNIDSFAVKKL